MPAQLFSSWPPESASAGRNAGAGGVTQGRVQTAESPEGRAGPLQTPRPSNPTCDVYTLPADFLGITGHPTAEPLDGINGSGGRGVAGSVPPLGTKEERTVTQRIRGTQGVPRAPGDPARTGACAQGSVTDALTGAARVLPTN